MERSAMVVVQPATIQTSHDLVELGWFAEYIGTTMRKIYKYVTVEISSNYCKKAYLGSELGDINNSLGRL